MSQHDDERASERNMDRAAQVVPVRHPNPEGGHKIHVSRINHTASNMARAAIERLEMEDTDVSDLLSREQLQDLYSDIWDALKIKLDDLLWQDIAP